ncbi:probable 2-oxoglutarate-dependent dioxygenase At3g111800 [Selaginella moellendorffii]|uniref:probable 2-oxoglutarate-dependent dioxygenase At3g111800 n=1 Tax=Selaginella moellendorffii TaxID=88036 RepID=UPI000D1C573B|nr:probable 2-oxoglutarate-dependent dioxygenase At3g111800 [Selaginella moellendorffii]|eukprot:XP_024520064.1 probable 2-oxoglutarate-dependent dioxygenase At3g111800 [Selaginella moellendorffii]
MTPSQETHMEWHDHFQHYFSNREKEHPWRLASSYVSSVKHLSQTLMSALSEGLGLDSNCLAKSFGDSEMILRSNYYPPCPNPDLALGMNGHTDSGGLTILFEDQVGGLQARKGDLWYDLKPIKNAFIVNIADQLEILSNGKYKSIEHRVLVQPDQTRLSIVAFCNPSRDAKLSVVEHRSVSLCSKQCVDRAKFMLDQKKRNLLDCLMSSGAQNSSINLVNIMFQKMPFCNIVSWNAVVAANAQLGYVEEMNVL